TITEKKVTDEKSNDSNNNYQSGKIYVDPNNFSDYFSSNGSAKGNYDKSSGVQTLTNWQFQAGSAEFNGSIDLNHDFSINGAINVGKKSQVGTFSGIADGIGFVFYRGNKEQVGGNGGNLGIYGVPNAFGWKADTWANHNYPDSSTNNPQILDGDYDNGLDVPYGSFVSTDNNGKGTIDKSSVKGLGNSIEDDKFHDISFNYIASSKTMTITLNNGLQNITFNKKIDFYPNDNGYHFSIFSSTGMLPTNQSFKIKSMSYSPLQRANINYIDDNLNKTIRTDSVQGTSGNNINYPISDNINEYEKRGYSLVSNNYDSYDKFSSDNVNDQNYYVHLKHNVETIGENNSQNPGSPIYNNISNGPNWPLGTDHDSLVKTIIRNINYIYASTGKKISNTVQQHVSFDRTVQVDKVTGQIVNISNWNSNNDRFALVKSPDLTKNGYNNPSELIVPDEKVAPSSDDVNITINYTKNNTT
ncbi:lectin-like domain-containing protein, partial [Apilactobacillus micheneri]